jgi:hypothetical protein
VDLCLSFSNSQIVAPKLCEFKLRIRSRLARAIFSRWMAKSGRTVGATALPDTGVDLGKSNWLPAPKLPQKGLLNYYYQLPHPGPNHMHAKRSVTWWPAAQDLFGEQREQQVFEDDVELDLKPASAAELRAVFSPYLAVLACENNRSREEAMQAITYWAPSFVEDTLLKMLDSDEWCDALVGLPHLNTKRAREALAKVIEFGVPIARDADDLEKAERSSEPSAAMKYLGEMGDPAYFRVLLQATEQAPPRHSDSNLRHGGGGQIRRSGRYSISRVPNKRFHQRPARTGSSRHVPHRIS